MLRKIRNLLRPQNQSYKLFNFLRQSGISLLKQELYCTFAHLFGKYLRGKGKDKKRKTSSISIAGLLRVYGIQS
jgi:hypothetical protein